MTLRALRRRKATTHEDIEEGLTDIFGGAFTGLGFEDRADAVQQAYAALGK